MLINQNKFALASSLAFGLLWIICSVLVMIFPDASMKLTMSMMHGGFAAHQWDMGMTGLISGLVAWMLVAGMTAWFIATIYNRLIKGD
jgi:hypothetical protein